MRRIIQGLAEEWERAVLWCAFLALVCLGIVCWRAVPDDGDRLPTPAIGQREAILGPDAYAFLNPGPSDPSTSDDAFAFAFRPPPTPVAIGDKQKVTTNETQVQDVTDSQVLDDKGQDAKQDAKQDPPPAAPRQLRYLGIYVSTTGERLAAIEIRDPATGQVQTAFRRHGQTCEGLRLDAFDGDSVQLLSPSGTQTRVCRGDQRTFQLSPNASPSE